MTYRNGNYAAFYVSEPFNENNLGANATKDFVSYNLLCAWKGRDSTFPFNDSHQKNYNVRDGSDWERTLKPRIHDRLNNSKNIVLFLSSITESSKALEEEINFGIGSLKLPIIVVYPEFSEKSDIINCDTKKFKYQIKCLWDKLPVFRDQVNLVPSLHIPRKKSLICTALENSDFMCNTAGNPGKNFYPC